MPFIIILLFFGLMTWLCIWAKKKSEKVKTGAKFLKWAPRAILFYFSLMVVALIFAPVWGGVGVSSSLLLLIGWAGFIWRIFPEITINWDGVLSFLIALGVFLFLGQYFLKWLYLRWRERELEGQMDVTSEPRPWQFQWTLAIAGLFFLMFSTGIGFIGATHQMVWAFSSDKSFVKQDEWPGHPHMKAQSNLHHIYLACKAYWIDNGGKETCTVSKVANAEYGFDPSQYVEIIATGTEEDFIALAEHRDSKKIWSINSSGTVIQEKD